MTSSQRRIVRAVVAACLALPLGLAARASNAHATESASDAKTKHLVATHTEGPRATEAAKLIADALGPAAEIAPSKDLKQALARTGQKLPFGIPITLTTKRGALMKRVGSATAAMEAEATIIGVTQKRRNGQVELLLLVVESGKDAPSIDQAIVMGQPGTADEVKAALADMTNAWASADASAPIAEPKDDGAGGDAAKPAPKTDETETETERPKNLYGHEIFGINAAFSLGGRFFGYNDGIGDNLRTYDVFGAPGAAFHAEVYPLATTGILILRDLGITGEFRTAFGISSATKDGTEVGTTWMRFGGGMRYRLPVGPEDKPFVFGLRGSFVKEGFTFDASGTLKNEAPSADYLFLRVGLDGRFPIGPLAITAFGGYLGALQAGDVHDRFRDTSLGGIDVGGGVVVPIALGFEAFVQAEYIRWFYAFAPVPGDGFVAGGALDEYIHLEIGPQYVY